MNVLVECNMGTQRHIRGSICSVRICLDPSGFDEAIESFFEEVFTFDGSLEALARIKVDVLSFPLKIETILAQSLEAFDQNKLSDSDSDALLNSAKKILSLSGVAKNDFSIGVLQSIKNELEMTLNRLFSESDAVVSEYPKMTEDVVERISDAVSKFKNSESGVNHRERLREAVNRLKELLVRSETPHVTEEIRLELISKITSEIKKLISSSLQQFVEEQMSVEWQSLIETKIQPKYSDYRKIRQRLLQNTEAVWDSLVEIHRVNSISSAGTRSTGALRIPSLDCDQVRHLVCRHFGGSNQLKEKFNDEFQTFLLQELMEPFPTVFRNGPSTPMAQILASLPPNVFAIKLRSFIESVIISELSIYKLIESKLADLCPDAYLLSSPLVNLLGRAVPQFNIEPTYNVIISLPRSRDSKDEQTIGKIKRLFRDLDINSYFTQPEEGSNIIEVTRISAGFPASSMSHLGDQRMSYLEATANGHLPHLPLFVSNDGTGITRKN